MATTGVQDIKVYSGGQWRSMRGGKVASGGWKNFGTGSGVAKNGNWYILNSTYIFRIVTNINISGLEHSPYLYVHYYTEDDGYPAVVYDGVAYTSPVILTNPYARPDGGLYDLMVEVYDSTGNYQYEGEIYLHWTDAAGNLVEEREEFTSPEWSLAALLFQKLGAGLPSTPFDVTVDITIIEI